MPIFEGRIVEILVGSYMPVPPKGNHKRHKMKTQKGTNKIYVILFVPLCVFILCFFVVPEGPDGAGPPLEAPRRVELSGAVLSFPAPGEPAVTSTAQAMH